MQSRNAHKYAHYYGQTHIKRKTLPKEDCCAEQEELKASHAYSYDCGEQKTQIKFKKNCFALYSSLT